MKPPATTKPPTPQPTTVPLAPPPWTDQLAPSLQPQPPKKEAFDGGGETQWGRGERGTGETRTSQNRATWSSIKVPLSGHLSRGAGGTEGQIIEGRGSGRGKLTLGVVGTGATRATTCDLLIATIHRVRVPER